MAVLMRILIKYLLAIVFLFSAVAKAIDYHETVQFFHKMYSIEVTILNLLVIFLIVGELSVALLFFTKLYEGRLVVYSIVLLFILFLVTNILMILNGAESCGCFGTMITLKPVPGLLKNIILIFLYLILLKSRKNGSRL